MTTLDTFQHFQQTIVSQQPSNSGSEIKQIGDEFVRIDADNQHHHHLRARQLSEFTTWLAGSANPDLASTTPVATPPIPTNTTATGFKTSSSTNYRVDSPAETVKNPILGVNNYTADPEEIQRIIQKLKSDGRILADLEQAPETTHEDIVKTASTRFDLKWPTVTTNLLGSPAILNLEMNVDAPPTNQQDFKQLVVTSTQRGSGATTVAISLARQLSRHSKRVLLVDANISNAAMTHRLGITGYRSWIQAISSRSTLSEVICQDTSSNIALLPIAPLQASVSWPRQIFNQLANMIDSIAWDFDFIVYDVGNYEQFIAESTSPSTMADLTLLVNGKNISGVADQRRAETQLTQSGVSELLIVQNFSRVGRMTGTMVG